MMDKSKVLEFWFETLKVPNGKYKIEFLENETSLNYKVYVEKGYLGKILGVSGVIYTTIKRLLQSSYIDNNKKVEIELIEK